MSRKCGIVGKVRIGDVFLALMILVCLSIESLVHLTPINRNVVFLAQMIVLFISCFMIFGNRHRCSPVCALIIGLYVYILVATYFQNSRNIMGYLRNALGSFNICLIFDFWMARSPKRFLRTIYLLLEILVYANFISVLMFPTGLYVTHLYWSNWLLGYKNIHIDIILPAITLSYVLSYYRYEKLKLRTILLVVVSIWSLFVVGSQMSLSVTIIFVLLNTLLIGKNTHKTQKSLRNFVNYRVLITIVLVAYVYFLVIKDYSSIEYIIVDIMNKNMSLSGRTVIWEICARLILEKPVLGWGFVDSTEYVALTGIAGATHAHNLILAVLIMGGLIGTGLLITAYYLSFKSIMKNALKAEYACLLSGLVLLIMGISVYNIFTPFLNAIFIMMYYLPRKRGAFLKTKRVC